MSTLRTGIGVVGGPASYVLDMRDEVITTMEQFTAALYRFRERHVEEILAIHLCPTQEYCLRTEHLTSLYNMKEDRLYTIEEIGQLQQVMGYRVIVGAEV